MATDWRATVCRSTAWARLFQTELNKALVEDGDNLLDLLSGRTRPDAVGDVSELAGARSSCLDASSFINGISSMSMRNHRQSLDLQPLEPAPNQTCGGSAIRFDRRRHTPKASMPASKTPVSVVAPAFMGSAFVTRRLRRGHRSPVFDPTRPRCGHDGQGRIGGRSAPRPPGQPLRHLQLELGGDRARGGFRLGGIARACARKAC